jgi:hypothetical protein
MWQELLQAVFNLIFEESIYAAILHNIIFDNIAFQDSFKPEACFFKDSP